MPISIFEYWSVWFQSLCFCDKLPTSWFSLLQIKFYLILNGDQHYFLSWNFKNGWVSILEEEMATHSSVLAWEIPWTEEPGGLQSTESWRVGHNLLTEQQHSWCHVSPLEIRTIWSDLEYFYAHLLLEFSESQVFRRHKEELSVQPHLTKGQGDRVQTP